MFLTFLPCSLITLLWCAGSSVVGVFVLNLKLCCDPMTVLVWDGITTHEKWISKF